MPKFYISLFYVCPNNISWDFFWGGATPLHVFYGYGRAPGPHQLNPALAQDLHVGKTFVAGI